MGNSWVTRILLAFLVGAMIGCVPCSQAHTVCIGNGTSLADFQMTKDVYIGSGVFSNDLDKSLVTPFIHLDLDNKAIRFVDVKGNATVSERNVLQRVLSLLEPYVEPQLDRAIKVIFVDQSGPEFLSQTGVSDRIWAGNGSLVEAKDAAFQSDAFPGYYFNETGVYSHGSDTIRVIRMDLFDKRTYADSPEWFCYILLENTGKYPVYVNTHFLGYGQGSQALADYQYLESGERMQVGFDNQAVNGHSLNQISLLEIDYCRTQRPEISPEFNNLTDFGTTKRTITPYQAPFVKINKVNLTVENAERNWKTMHIEYGPTGNSTRWDRANPLGTNLYFSFNGISHKVILKKDENVQVLDIPLRGMDPGYIRDLSMSLTEGY